MPNGNFMISETEVQAEYIVAADELASRLCESIQRYVNIEMRVPVSDSHILNWFVYQNQGQPYDCGYLQFDLGMDVVQSALKKAHRSRMIMTTKEGDDITAYPIDWKFDIVLFRFY
jgi:hypothetical protein